MRKNLTTTWATSAKALTLLAADLAILPALAFAEAEGEHHGILSLKWYWLNFLIYIGALYFLCRAPLKKVWDSRREQIRAAIAAAQNDAAVAKQELLDAERKLSTLGADSAKLASDIERETQREGADILVQAKTRAERLGVQAKDLAEAEKRATEAAIRSELVSLAMKKAEERLEKEITPQNDKAIRDTALSSVQQLIQ